MRGQGEFTTLRRDGEYVVKTLTPEHPAGSRFVGAMLAVGRDGVARYVAALREAGVVLPADLEMIEDGGTIAVRHRWIRGLSLPKVAAAAPSAFVDAISTIGAWVVRLEAADARLDTNLVNFCLDGDRLVAVDVLPPLIPSRQPAPCDLFDTLFFALCFQTPVTLAALVGYAARHLFPYADPAAVQDFAAVAAALCPGLEDRSTEEFPGMWFRARAALALRALRGQVAPEAAVEFFAWTSVLAFRRLDEQQRAERISHVHARVKELVL